MLPTAGIASHDFGRKTLKGDARGSSEAGYGKSVPPKNQSESIVQPDGLCGGVDLDVC